MEQSPPFAPKYNKKERKMLMLKNKLKKAVSALACAVMLISVLPCTSYAAKPVGTVRLLDFEGMGENDLSAFKGDWYSADWGKNPAEDTALHYSGADNVFGRNSRAAHFYNDPTVSYTKTDPWQMVAINENDKNEADALKVDNPGEGWKMSFDFAYDGKLNRADFQGQCWSSNANNGNAWNTFFYVNADSSVGGLKGNTGYKLNKQKWYNIEIRIYKTNDNAKNFYEMFINGKLVQQSSELVMANKWKCFQGFKCMRIGQYVFPNGASTSDGLYEQADMYLDNFRVELLGGQLESVQRTEETADFNNSQDGRPETYRGGFRSITLKNAELDSGGSESFEYAIEDSVMGKDAEDKAIHIYNNPNTPITAADPYAFITLEDSLDTRVVSKKGSYHQTSFQMALSDLSYACVTAFFNRGDSQVWADKNKQNFIEVKNGLVYIWNKATNVLLQKNKFYKFDVVTYCGEISNAENPNTVKLYIDDELVYTIDNYVPECNGGQIETFGGFYRFWFGAHMYAANQTVGSLQPQRDAWFDEIKVSVSESEPQFTPARIASNDAEFAKYLNGGLSMFVDSNAVWNNNIFVEGEEGATISLKKADGTAVAVGDKIEGNCYYKIERENDVLYGAINNSQTVGLNESFAEYQEGYKASYWTMTDRAYSKYVYPGGVAGRQANDFSMKIQTDNYTGDTFENGVPYLHIYTRNSNPGEGNLGLTDYAPTHVEYSLLIEGDDYDEVNFWAMPAGTSDDWFKAITFKNDLNAYDKNGNVVDSYRKNQWIKVEVSIYPSGNAIVKLNGKTVYNGTCFENVSDKRMLRFKMEQAFWQEEGVSKSGAFYIDDLKVYQGSYNVKASESDMRLEAKNNDYADYAVYNSGKALIMTNSVDVLDLYTDINRFNGSAAIYKNSSLTEKVTSGDVGDRNILVMTNGDIYKYYEIRVDEALAPSAFEMAGVFDKAGSDLTVSGITAGKTVEIIPAISLSKPNMKLRAIAVQYDKDGKLLKLSSVGSVYNYTAGDQDEYVFTNDINNKIKFEAENVEGSYVKIMIWNGLNAAVPYIGAKTVPVNTAVAD